MDKLVPEESYGVFKSYSNQSNVEKAIESVKRVGYAVLESGFTSGEIGQISFNFDEVYDAYCAKHSMETLSNIDEQNTIRALFTQPLSDFLKIATNNNLLGVVNGLISGRYVLNQQNGIINPSMKRYNQGCWHRDLPYQSFTSSRPLAINALFCLDEFTSKNGGTFVLPGSHLFETFPSDSYLQENAIQISADAGSYIILDCMLFHSGGVNKSDSPRRAINQVFTIPYFKQQINLPAILENRNFSKLERELLGFEYQMPNSVEEYLLSRGER
jgi:ectoine hydroxylase-related dioxygenase (phytanoyl-CoA dioxygenase family)